MGLATFVAPFHLILLYTQSFGFVLNNLYPTLYGLLTARLTSCLTSNNHRHQSQMLHFVVCIFNFYLVSISSSNGHDWTYYIHLYILRCGHHRFAQAWRKKLGYQLVALLVCTLLFHLLILYVAILLVECFGQDFTLTLGEGCVGIGCLVEVIDEFLAVILLGILWCEVTYYSYHLRLRNQSAGSNRKDAEQRVVANTFNLQRALRETCIIHELIENLKITHVRLRGYIINSYFHLRLSDRSRAIVLPRAIMLVGLLGTSGHFLLILLFALFQSLVLLLALFDSHSFCEDCVIEIQQLVGIGCGGEHNATQIMRLSVHLGLCEHWHTHLILKDGLTHFATKHQMQTVAGRAAHLKQSNLCLHLKHLLCYAIALVQTGAIHIVGEHWAGVTSALHLSIRHQVVVGYLHQLVLCLLVALSSLSQIAAILSRVAQVKVLLLRVDGLSHLFSVSNKNLFHI